jgi:hypothetical protein
VNVIKPKRIKNKLYRGNKPSDGETKIMPTIKEKKAKAARTPQGSRRPRNRGRA